MNRRSRLRGGSSVAPEVTKSSRSRKSKWAETDEDDEYTVVFADCPYEVEEKVLCYEPDPLKCKVLYEAKVLKVVCGKNQNGKKEFQYLIHFQGWNSSWDRYVADDLLMKDDEENRKLQEELNEIAAVQLKKGKYKKRRAETQNSVGEREVSHTKRVKTTARKSRKGEVEQYVQLEDIEGLEDNEDEYNVLVTFSENFYDKLATDHIKVCEKNLLPTLPARISVAHVLEKYVRSTALRKLDRWYKKHQWDQIVASRATTSAVITTGVGTNTNKGNCSVPAETKIPEELQKLFHEVTLMKQFVSDMHIAFEISVHLTLLYDPEMASYADRYSDACRKWSSYTPLIVEIPEGLNFAEDDVRGKLGKSEKEDVTEAESGSTAPSTSGYPSRSSSKETRSGGCGEIEETSNENLCKNQIQYFVNGLLEWRLVGNIYPRPSLVYGIPHLLRLLVKMPDIVAKQMVTKSRCLQIAAFINEILSFVLAEFEDSDVVYEESSPIQNSN